MTILRHSREMTRHHRERIIKRRKKLFDAIWYSGWGDKNLGYLSKHSTHHHHCHMCNDGAYNRTKAKREEQQYYGSIPYNILRNGHR